MQTTKSDFKVNSNVDDNYDDDIMDMLSINSKLSQKFYFKI